MFPLTEVIYTRRPRGYEPIWLLFDLYRIGPTFGHQFTVVGELRPINGGYSMDYNALPTGRRRHDLQGIVIPCGFAVD